MYNLVTDLLCSLLPLAAVWKVRIPLRTKMLISGLMSMGFLYVYAAEGTLLHPNTSNADTVFRATGFGVARALSLRLRTNDMSCKYQVSAR